MSAAFKQKHLGLFYLSHLCQLKVGQKWKYNFFILQFLPSSALWDCKIQDLSNYCQLANQSCCFIYHFGTEQGGPDKKWPCIIQEFSNYCLQFGTSSERYQSNAISNETDDDSDCYVCTRELAGAPNYSVGYNCCLSDTPPPPPSDTQMLRCSDHQKYIKGRIAPSPSRHQMYPASGQHKISGCF